MPKRIMKQSFIEEAECIFVNNQLNKNSEQLQALVCKENNDEEKLR